MDDFSYKRKSSYADHKLKDEWDTRDDAGKSSKNALHRLWYAKGTSQAEEKSSSEKNQTCRLSHCRVMLD